MKLIIILIIVCTVISLGIPCSKFHEQIYNDRYEISWVVERKQPEIDATCKELTDVILNNL